MERPLDGADVGAMVGVAEFPYSGLADAKPLGQCYLCHALIAHCDVERHLRGGDGVSRVSCVRTGTQPQGSGFQRRPRATAARANSAAIAVNTAETSMRTVFFLSCTGMVENT